MKILHVIPSIALSDGGPATAIRALTQQLTTYGHEITLATTDADGTGRLTTCADSYGMPAVQVHQFPRRTRLSYKWSPALATWLRVSVASFDVVHVHGLFTFSTLAASRSAMRARVPFVIRPIGTLDPWSMRQSAWRKASYLKLVERPHLEASAAIHVTSDMERAALEQLGFGKKTWTVPFGVGAPPALTPSPERAPTIRAGTQPTRLLFLSRLHPVKGIPTLLRALARMRESGLDVELTIAGEGEPAYRNALEQDARTLGVAHVTAFVGYVAGQRKAELFAASDVFVLPSHHENFGMAAAEALAAGLPVVLSDQVAIAGDVQRAGAGIACTQDVDSLAAAIARLVHDAPLRAIMSRTARALAADRYSWDRCARQLITLYERVAHA